MTMIRARTLVTVTLKIPVPIYAPADDVSEWLKFNLGKNAGMKMSNPLANYDPEPNEMAIWFNDAAPDDLEIAARRARALITDLMNGVERTAHQEVIHALTEALGNGEGN